MEISVEREHGEDNSGLTLKPGFPPLSNLSACLPVCLNRSQGLEAKLWTPSSPPFSCSCLSHWLALLTLLTSLCPPSPSSPSSIFFFSFCLASGPLELYLISFCWVN